MNPEKMQVEQAWDDPKGGKMGTGAMRRGSVVVGNMIIENPLQVSHTRPHATIQLTHSSGTLPTRWPTWAAPLLPTTASPTRRSCS